MSKRLLSNWLSAYLEFTNISEAPDSFHFWVGVWTISGALRRKVFIDMGHFQWVPNFYIFLVSPPGIVSKSTCLNIGASMLKELPTVKFGPESMTWQSLVEALSQAKEEIPWENEDGPCFFPMSCISIAAGELGTLVTPSNREMVHALVSLWDGRLGNWEKWTKGCGKDSIVNPFINIASCTTPAWIAQNFPEDLVGGGFTSRCLFVYAEKKKRLLAYPQTQLPKEFKKMREYLVHDLDLISTLAGEYKLTPAAFKYGELWYEEHHTKESSLDSSRLGGYLARKQTHIHKVAMVLAASESNELIITEDHLKSAALLVTELEADMNRVFENIGLEGAGKKLSLLLQVLRSYHKLEKGELFARVCFKMSLEEFNQALVAGASGGQLKVFATGDKILVHLAGVQ